VGSKVCLPVKVEGMIGQRGVRILRLAAVARSSTGVCGQLTVRIASGAPIAIQSISPASCIVTDQLSEITVTFHVPNGNVYRGPLVLDEYRRSLMLGLDAERDMRQSKTGLRRRQQG
jgi:hypothetical protein